MSAVVAAVAFAVAYALLRARSNQSARLEAISSGAPSGVTTRLDGARRRVASRRRRRSDVVAAEAATVEAVFALAAELRAGRPPSRALALVAPQLQALSQPLAVAAGAVASGAPAGDELRRIADAPGCAGWRSVAAAWEVTSRAGGPVADVLDRLGEVLDAERHARTALSAAMAGSRATMFLLATLPAFGLALGQAMGAHPLDMLLHSPMGWGLLTVAGVLDTLGVLWTLAIIRRALR